MHEREKGFSLIELLVVVSIIVLFTTFMLTRPQGVNGTVRIESSVNTVLSALRQARHDSIAVKKYEGKFPSYGVYAAVNGTDITLYADCVADDALPTGVDAGDTFHFVTTSNCGGANSTVQVVALEQGVTVSAIEAKQAGGVVASLDNISVQFLRPHPATMIVGGAGASQTLIPNAEASIVLKENRTNTTRTITINTNGVTYMK